MIFGRNSLLIILLLGLGSGLLRANNLRFSGVSSDFESVFFEISWDNAWNLDQGVENHDAIWIFAKFLGEDGQWHHLPFHTDSLLHEVDGSSGLAIVPSSQGEGVMLKNEQIGARNVADVKLKLRLAQFVTLTSFRFRIYGIEMAYVSEGPLWLGDGGSNSCLGDNTLQPYLISNEQAIPLGQVQSQADFPPDQIIPESFPKGYSGFYLMKHELGQAQYADFLNTLTYAQQQARTAASPHSAKGTLAMSVGQANRNAIVIETPGEAGGVAATYACDNDNDGSQNSHVDAQSRACNWLNWDDLMAYLDWAALRPMTEFEFEKAARGPNMPILGEFAWGTDSIIDANTVIEDGSPLETVSETATASAGLGSHGYTGPQGPLRAGFGSHANSNRLQAGAGYYGNMELSGNLWEFCVPAFAGGLSFQGGYGDGTISDSGTANVPDWPSEGGYRGGGWNSGIIPGFRDLAISDRFYIGLNSTTRRNTTGGRGAR